MDYIDFLESYDIFKFVFMRLGMRNGKFWVKRWVGYWGKDIVSGWRVVLGRLFVNWSFSGL